MKQVSPTIMPEMADSVIGSRLTETLVLGGRDVCLARPAAPERLLDLASVADAYARDQYMPYWATLWPVAKHLAAAILKEPWPAGRRGIELGCGLGLPGVAGLLAGIDVTFTDYDASALRFAAENARLNGFPAPKTRTLDWRCPPPETFDVIIASDLTYEERNVEPLVSVFAALLAPGGVVMLADQNRAYAPQLQAALRAQGFTYRVTACAADPAAGLEVAGTIYRISRSA